MNKMEEQVVIVNGDLRLWFVGLLQLFTKIFKRLKSIRFFMAARNVMMYEISFPMFRIPTQCWKYWKSIEFQN